MGRRIKIIPEYRQTGEDVDWDGDWWDGVRVGTKYFTVSSSTGDQKVTMTLH